MEFHKCSRCGCFFVTESSVCPNCQPKDQMEMSVLKSFLAGCTEQNKTVEGISASTGISVKNLERFFSQNEFSDYSFLLNRKNVNLDINL